jgi:hypothetical protein
MPKAVPKPTALDVQREYRALQLFDQIPAGHAAFPILDDCSHPHLRCGEIALIDTSDLDPVHGELFVIQWDNGSRQIKQLIGRTARHPKGYDYLGWWTTSLFTRDFLPGYGYVRTVDGPRLTEMIKEAIVGRVVGILESLSINVGEPR